MNGDPLYASAALSHPILYIASNSRVKSARWFRLLTFGFSSIKATPEQQKAAVDFLNYMALSEDGANYMVAEAGMVPAFKSVRPLPTGQFSKALVEANARGGNFNWYFGQNPDGFNQYTLGPIFELLATDGNVKAFVIDVTAAFAGVTPIP